MQRGRTQIQTRAKHEKMKYDKSRNSETKSLRNWEVVVLEKGGRIMKHERSTKSLNENRNTKYPQRKQGSKVRP